MSEVICSCLFMLAFFIVGSSKGFTSEIKKGLGLLLTFMPTHLQTDSATNRRVGIFTADLLDAVHPAFGVISDGFENSYGHPHPLTLQALESRHIAVYRTDERGLVRFISDGKRIHIE